MARPKYASGSGFTPDVGLDDFISTLSSLDIALYAEQALEESAPILEERLRSLSEAHSRTGRMAGSIRTGKPKKKNDVYRIFVGPAGSSNGVRNMDKMLWLEYGHGYRKGQINTYASEFGTFKGQKATPVITPAVVSSRTKVQDKLQSVFSKYLDSKNL